MGRRSQELSNNELAQLGLDRREWMRPLLLGGDPEVQKQCAEIVELCCEIDLILKRTRMLPKDLFTGDPPPTPAEVIAKLRYIKDGGR